VLYQKTDLSEQSELSVSDGFDITCEKIRISYTLKLKHESFDFVQIAGSI
jgi:hypothetical protein